MRGLFDYEYQLEKINAHKPPLQKLNEVIDWEWFRTALEDALRIEPKAPGGRPSYDRVLMFKIRILQKYYNLSNEQAEFQIKDRLSFMQFLGLQIGDSVPDQNTIQLFKEKLSLLDLSKTLFDLFAQKLVEHDIVAREGSIVDAAFVEVPRQRNTREENADIKQDAVPLAFGTNKAKLTQKDCDARWTKKNNENHYGYKNHVNADMKTKLITGYTTTSAAPHDSTETEKLLGEDDNVAYADSAYRSAEIETYLKSVNCKSHIHEKGHRNKPLDIEQQLRNRMKSKIRARVEHIFGFMTNSMNNALFMRAIGLKRIHSEIGLLNLTYNLFRYEQLIRCHGMARI